MGKQVWDFWYVVTRQSPELFCALLSFNVGVTDTHTRAHTPQALSLLQQAQQIDRQAVPVFESSNARSKAHTHSRKMEKEWEKPSNQRPHGKKEKNDFKGHWTFNLVFMCVHSC